MATAFASPDEATALSRGASFASAVPEALLQPALCLPDLVEEPQNRSEN